MPIVFDEKGQGLAEYALLLILAVFIIVIVVALLGPPVANLYANIVENVETVQP